MLHGITIMDTSTTEGITVFIRLLKNGTAKVIGLQQPNGRILARNQTTIVLKIPGHRYTVGNRNSMVKPGYTPARNIVFIIDIVEEDGALRVTELISFSKQASWQEILA